MSAKSLAKLAARRDAKTPGQSVVNDSTDALVAVVPTEALTAYTAVVGVVLAANIGTAYGPFRWSAYGAFIALAVPAPLVLFKHRTATSTGGRSLPILECLTAGIAAAAWGLVMPGSPLTMIIKGNALVFAPAQAPEAEAEAAPAAEADAPPQAEAAPAQAPEAEAEADPEAEAA